MNDKSRKKLDILMTILMIVVMSYQATGNLFHEVAGVILLILFVVHNILNRKWYKNILKGKYSRANEIEITDNIDAVSSASLNLENGEIIGNTEIIAQEIAAATGADIYPIITENAYPANYTGTLLKAGVEIKTFTYR